MTNVPDPTQWAITPFDWSSPEMLARGNPNDPGVRRAMAEQFEALLIGQILRSMRESMGDGFAGGTGEAADTGLMELAEQQLAMAMAAGGGFGLSRLLAEQALKLTSGTASSEAAHSAGDHQGSKLP